jgi:hypothetical protein
MTDERIAKNVEGPGYSLIKVLSWHMPEVTDKNHGQPQ